MNSHSAQSESRLKLRTGQPGDAETLGTICYEAFSAIADEHNFPHDFPNAGAGIGLISMLLGRSDVYSVVADYDGKTVGSNFLWEGDAVKGVGPITVKPSVQNSSIGRQLMEDVMARAESAQPLAVRLVQSAYHNRSLSLYTKLGFDVTEPLSAIQGTPLQSEIAGTHVRPMTQADRAQADELCIRVHGHDRHNEMGGAIDQGIATVVERSGRITGYATGIGFFGHAVAESNDDLKALIAGANEFFGPGFLLPTRNAEVLRWCLENGLRIVQPMTLMNKGFYQEPRGSFMPSVLF